MAHITYCKVENILGTKSVELKPPPEGLTIGGTNGSGKSSVIWALAMALGGREQLPQQPVNNGADRGEVTIELDQYDVKLVVSADRKSTLTVKSKDGAVYQAPQQILNRLFGGLSFDPGAFRLMDGKKQAEVLKQIGKINFSDLDADYARAYEDRRDMGRKVKELEGKLAGQKLHEGVPEEEQAAGDLLGQIKELGISARELAEAEQKESDVLREIKLLTSQARLTVDRHKQINDQMKRLAIEAKECEADIERITGEIGKWTEEEKAIQQVKADCTEAVKRDQAEAAKLQEQFDALEATNRKIRENQKLIELKKEWRAAKSTQEHYAVVLGAIEAKKKEMLAEAPFPIEGLSFVEGGVAVGGVPFEQLSESQQWEISLAIGFALNPKGIMFMRNSGGMDRKTRDRLRQRAKALGVQLFLEVVDSPDDAVIVIEEGVVDADRTLQTGESKNANS